MPSDVFSRLLKAKQELRRNKDDVSVDDVVSTFLPFLKVIASAKKRPTADTSAVLSSALFDYIRTESRAVNVKKALATMKETPPAEELGSAKRKRNGKLDQVSDDCLRHALSFLTFKQRCRIESTYARLFHLSRALPLPKEKTMDEITGLGEDFLAMYKTLNGKNQLRTEDFVCLGSRFDTLSVTGFVAQRGDVVRALKERIVELDMYDTMDALLGLRFPCLRRLNCANGFCLSRFLERHIAVSELSVAVDDIEKVPNRQFWKTIAKLKNISTLHVQGFIGGTEEALFGDIPEDCDFSHIANMHLTTEYSTRFDFDAVQPLLHAALESLSLTCTPPFARMRLPKLKLLRLYYIPDGYLETFSFDPYLEQFFDALDASQLEDCILVHFNALDVIGSLHKCNARALCYKMESVDFNETVEVHRIDEAFRKAVANGITVKDFTLDLCYFKDVEEHLDPTDDYSDLIAFLRGIVRLKSTHWETLRVCIAPDTWQLWEAVLKGFADTLKPFVAF